MLDGLLLYLDSSGRCESSLGIVFGPGIKSFFSLPTTRGQEKSIPDESLQADGGFFFYFSMTVRHFHQQELSSLPCPFLGAPIVSFPICAPQIRKGWKREFMSGEEIKRRMDSCFPLLCPIRLNLFFSFPFLPFFARAKTKTRRVQDPVSRLSPHQKGKGKGRRAQSHGSCM